MNDVIGTDSGAFEKTGAGTSKLESSTFLIFYFFEITAPSVAGESYVQFFESFLGKNSPQSEYRVKGYARFKEDPPN
jgi:hypothetical protein